VTRHARQRPGLSYLWYLLRTVVVKVAGLAIFIVIAPTLAITAMILVFWLSLVVSIVGGGLIKKDIY
jgi:hypothetical protein